MPELGEYISKGAGYIGRGLHAVLDPTVGQFGRSVVFPVMEAIEVALTGTPAAAPVAAAAPVTWAAFFATPAGMLLLGGGALLVVGGTVYYVNYYGNNNSQTAQANANPVTRQEFNKLIPRLIALDRQNQEHTQAIQEIKETNRATQQEVAGLRQVHAALFQDNREIRHQVAELWDQVPANAP